MRMDKQCLRFIDGLLAIVFLGESDKMGNAIIPKPVKSELSYLSVSSADYIHSSLEF